MCGIFGFTSTKRREFTEEKLRGVIERLVSLSERRGNEAAGVVGISGDNICLFKKAVKPRTMLKERGFNQFINKMLCLDAEEGAPLIVIGHTRLVTNGSQAIAENNQPIRCGHLIGVHNGIVTNDRSIIERYEKEARPLQVNSDSDTETLFSLINNYFEKELDIETAISRAYQEINGTASIALLFNSLNAIVLATNTGSLYYSGQKSEGFFVFGSERYIIEQFLKKCGLGVSIDHRSIDQLESFNMAILKFGSLTPEIYPLNHRFKKNSTCHIMKRKTHDFIDTSVSVDNLRRCSKCVLPETFPFITFDEEGVCNYCRRYVKQKFLGRTELEKTLSKYRSKDGRPDCIVGFSGGRDSSYGLHLLKKELGMHPIAYTYDWGMVTDLARRNQAKITGKLGVEHVIRSADIHTKRRYIRKNIFAWLKKPELGMVPLFMAGDKMFYYYGRQLRRETKIKLTVFACGYQLEQMEFKLGFCGVDQPLVNNQKMYYYNTMVKIRIALYYLWQYITNPAYINESFIDSIFSYYCSFINKDDYLYLYNYIPWDEKTIDDTLRNVYDWEVDKKFGKNQWRMGDGHTAFIDYIYYTIAGFSEFDNFRSNQIREGLITRDAALNLIREDNRTKIGMLLDFSQLIGFNLEDVLLRINTIPKLYEKQART